MKKLTPGIGSDGQAAGSADATVTAQARGEVLTVNRDPELRLQLNRALFASDFNTTSAASEDEALACLRLGGFSAVVVSVDHPEALDCLSRLRDENADVCIVALARAATPELVRDVMKCGADDFLFGSFNAKTLSRRLLDSFGQSLQRSAPTGSTSMGSSSAEAEVVSRESGAGPATLPLTVPLAGGDPFDSLDLVCKSEKMARVLEIAGRIAPTDSTVLVEGESGTGKELIARWVHRKSGRKDKAFVDINCGALPENLLESQLFGHEKGSFTGAVHRQLGLFEIADGGSIFLDEIGEMGLDMQVKLLRVLQMKEFRRIGGSETVKVDVRVIAATNRDLKKEVEQGRFRTDLYYRLNVIRLDLPPLRERAEAIPGLIESFTERLAERHGTEPKVFEQEAVDELSRLAWAGNIRELENAVERLTLLSIGERVNVGDVREHLEGMERQLDSESTFSASMSLDEVKRLHIAKVLKENEGNKMKTARILKINVKTLYNLIKSLEITF